MRLETSNGATVTNPDERRIDEALQNLAGDDAFAILSKDEMTYIQAAGTSADGFVLEYQDGDTDRHFIASGGPHSLDRASKAFRQYAVADLQWRNDFQWEQQELPTSNSGCAGMFLILVLGGAGGIAWLVRLII